MASFSGGIKIQNICRTCLSREIDLVSVFDVFTESITLQNVISLVTGIEITPDDGLPTNICTKCRDKASIAYDFQSRFHEVNQLFYQVIKQDTHKETINEVEYKLEKVKTENVNDAVDYMDVDLDLPIASKNDDEIKSISEDIEKKKPTKRRITWASETQVRYFQKQPKLSGVSSMATYCPMCDKSFDNVDSYTKHTWDIHADIGRPKKRGRPRKLKTNMLRKNPEDENITKENEEDKNECTVCKEEFKTKEDLDVHIMGHKDTIVISCMLCKNIYTTFEYFQSHACAQPRVFIDKPQTSVSTDEAEGLDVLPMASQTMLQEVVGFNTQTEICHVRVCEACGRVFVSSDELDKHTDLEHPGRSLRCHLCEKVFASVKSAERHRVSCKRAERTFACSTCGLKFAFEISLNKHILRNHAGERVSVRFMNRQKPQYRCDSCDQTFDSKDELIDHNRVHETPDKCVCDLCHKKFKRRSNLKAHMSRVHDPDHTKASNSGLCLYCGRSFNNSSNLIVHMRRHTGEKPYQCDFCGKGFPRSSDLQCHRRSHTGEKPCKCKICGKGFSRSNKLSRHMRVHTGDKPYKCTYCDKAFSQSNDLTLHVRRHTGDKPYVCEVCGDRFIQGTALQNHRRAHGHYPQAQASQTSHPQSSLAHFTFSAE